MSERSVRKIKRLIRKLVYHHRMDLMDWQNAWYADVKEEGRRQYQEYLDEQNQEEE